MENNYEQLVKALRLCQFGECGCGKCYYKELKGDWATENNHPEFFDCDDKLKLDAADAIEALRKRLVSALTALHLANEKMGYYGIQPYTEADGEDMISDWVKTLVHEELEQQLPKRGEIVRCRDCKWYQEGYDIDGKWFSRCNGSVRTYGQTTPDWYCADGEREVQDGTD